MSERITRANLEESIANLNRRMESRGSIYRYSVEGRNGYTGLDRETRIGDTLGRVDTVRAGTKRDIYELLHAMQVVLDDASVTT